uniref:C2H2-type domain-containing protein n=1 Tax=Chromera velia CCMP2878 TaxID=1169474 RepID=A0A0G4GY72_9ALVE|eukprot:Cvel_23879.t1-p1 / transcript=Cvel_23879.t1 / gene=Cvel_23879 / organism=Chromera_velia_CCMP2878 / gene_product=hypothetical protein / transcript_product=hypothetical protein / location=Cvel_scaffold2514:12757-23469(-) / protein_length=738 / sequence_SO=supercontig / SO=protein_coding / is_pseudo=false
MKRFEISSDLSLSPESLQQLSSNLAPKVEDSVVGGADKVEMRAGDRVRDETQSEAAESSECNCELGLARAYLTSLRVSEALEDLAEYCTELVEEYMEDIETADETDLSAECRMHIHTLLYYEQYETQLRVTKLEKVKNHFENKFQRYKERYGVTLVEAATTNSQDLVERKAVDVLAKVDIQGKPTDEECKAAIVKLFKEAGGDLPGGLESLAPPTSPSIRPPEVSAPTAFVERGQDETTRVMEKWATGETEEQSFSEKPSERDLVSCSAASLTQCEQANALTGSAASQSTLLSVFPPLPSYFGFLQTASASSEPFRAPSVTIGGGKEVSPSLPEVAVGVDERERESQREARVPQLSPHSSQATEVHLIAGGGGLQRSPGAPLPRLPESDAPSSPQSHGGSMGGSPKMLKVGAHPKSPELSAGGSPKREPEEDELATVRPLYACSVFLQAHYPFDYETLFAQILAISKFVCPDLLLVNETAPPAAASASEVSKKKSGIPRVWRQGNTASVSMACGMDTKGAVSDGLAEAVAEEARRVTERLKRAWMALTSENHQEIHLTPEIFSAWLQHIRSSSCTFALSGPDRKMELSVRPEHNRINDVMVGLITPEHPSDTVFWPARWFDPLGRAIIYRVGREQGPEEKGRNVGARGAGGGGQRFFCYVCLETLESEGAVKEHLKRGAHMQNFKKYQRDVEEPPLTDEIFYHDGIPFVKVQPGDIAASPNDKGATRMSTGATSAAKQ